MTQVTALFSYCFRQAGNGFRLCLGASRVFLLFLLFVQCMSNVRAQGLRWNIAAGGGYSFLSAKNTSEQYRGIYSWHATAFLHIPVAGIFGAETGIGFARKGYSGEFMDRSRAVTVKQSQEARYDCVHIPLLATLRLWSRPSGEFRIAAGMSYNLITSATVARETWMWRKDTLIRKENSVTHPKRSLVPSSSWLNSGEITRIPLLDVTFRVQAGYYWRRRFFISIFHEHSLYDFNIGGAEDLKMRYTGASLGWIIN